MSELDMAAVEEAAEAASNKEADAICVELARIIMGLIPDAVPAQERVRYAAHVMARAAGMVGCEGVAELADADPDVISAFADGAVGASSMISAEAVRHGSEMAPISSLLRAMAVGYQEHALGMLAELQDKALAEKVAADIAEALEGVA
jgi:hypothetical protein